MSQLHYKSTQNQKEENTKLSSSIIKKIFFLIICFFSSQLANSVGFSLSNDLSRKDRALRLGFKLKAMPIIELRYGLPQEYRDWIAPSPYTYYEIGVILNPYRYSDLPQIPWLGKTLRIRTGLGTKRLSANGDLKQKNGAIIYEKESLYKIKSQDIGLYLGISSEVFRSKSFDSLVHAQMFIKINWFHFYLPLFNSTWSFESSNSCKILESENKKRKDSIKNYSLFLFHLEIGFLI